MTGHPPLMSLAVSLRPVTGQLTARLSEPRPARSSPLRAPDFEASGRSRGTARCHPQTAGSGQDSRPASNRR